MREILVVNIVVAAPTFSPKDARCMLEVCDDNCLFAANRSHRVTVTSGVSKRLLRIKHKYCRTVCWLAWH